MCLQASSKLPLAANAVARSTRSAVSARTKVRSRWAEGVGEDCDRIGATEAGRGRLRGYLIAGAVLLIIKATQLSHHS